ncbi:MAG: SAM-dependent methyltransferase [Rhodoferax sp.]|nr:SAM-dependent methyltransferase [Rhodoferax sp.]
MVTPPSLTSDLQAHVAQVITDSGGWIGFDRFMALALYAPGLGYYVRGDSQIGPGPGAAAAPASDFATAPVISPLFGRALAVQVGEALRRSGTDTVWEFGAGTGAMAAQLLEALGEQVRRYVIVDLSGSLQQRQRATLARFADKLAWATQLPETLRGVVVGNEVLDAMPVRLLVRTAGRWHERGVVLAPHGQLGWGDRTTELRPPVAIDGDHDYLTEIHPQAEAFMGTLVDRLAQGAVFLIDYGFGEREYYHPQRSMGTVMCHQLHRADGNPLLDVGAKDITAHVNFTGIALAAQQAADEAGVAGHWHLLGYASQARFLLNCGLAGMMESASLPERSMANKLLMEHEMGELFKVIGFCRGTPWDAIGFVHGDRSHNL